MADTDLIPGDLRALLLEHYWANRRDLPWRHTRDPYHIWVSEIMLQQTRVEAVIPYWLAWMEAFPTVEALAAASEAVEAAAMAPRRSSRTSLSLGRGLWPMGSLVGE